MIIEFCHDKPKNEKCVNCNADLIDCTTYDELMRGERHFIRGRNMGFCARDEHQSTKQQAIEFWHSIPATEREEKYGGLSEFIYTLESRGYIRDEEAKN